MPNLAVYLKINVVIFPSDMIKIILEQIMPYFEGEGDSE